MNTRAFSERLHGRKEVPAMLLLVLTVLLFSIASNIDDGWMVKAVMAISALLAASMLLQLRAEEQRRLQSVRFNTALSVSKLALWIRDFNRGTIEWTDSIDGLARCGAGKFPRTILGWLAAIHPDDLPRASAALEAGRGGGKKYDVEYRLIAETGAAFWVRDTGDEPIKGQPTGVLHGALQDIDERRTAADKAALLEAQLRHAQRSEVIGNLAGGIAHDFNNVLTGILGNAELVLLDMNTNGDGESYRSSMETIVRAGNRAGALVQQILRFSRRTGQSLAPLAVAPMVHEVMALLRSTVPANIELVASVPAGLPDITADATQIHQVLVNLCTNGVHAMRGTNGRLVVSVDTVEAGVEFLKTHPELRAGTQIHLTVTDTGHGMDLETLKHIFEPFFTTKEPGEGTGLGLAIVQGIVKEHGGNIDCHSHTGEGTTFHVYFPATGVRAEAPGSSGGSSAHPLTHYERVLLVDDETDLLSTTSLMLGRLGYRVTCATDGDSAVTAFKEDPDAFALVITDLAMRHGTGLELAKRLRRIRPHVPIALMTGYPGHLTEESLQKVGIAGLVLKPFTMERLGQAVRQIIDKRVNAEISG